MADNNPFAALQAAAAKKRNAGGTVAAKLQGGNPGAKMSGSNPRGNAIARRLAAAKGNSQPPSGPQNPPESDY